MGQVQSELSITVCRPLISESSMAASDALLVNNHYVVIRSLGMRDQLITNFPARRVLPIDHGNPQNVEILIVRTESLERFLAHEWQPRAHLVIPYTVIADIAPKDGQLSNPTCAVHFLGFSDRLSVKRSPKEHFQAARLAAFSINNSKISLMMQWAPANEARGCAATVTDAGNDHLLSVLENADAVLRGLHQSAKGLAPNGFTTEKADLDAQHSREIEILTDRLATQKDKYDAEIKYLHKLTKKSQQDAPLEEVLTRRVNQLTAETDELVKENNKRKEETRHLLLHNRQLEYRCQAADAAKEEALRLFAESARNSHLMNRLSPFVTPREPANRRSPHGVST
eukprot:GEMP01037758.1.p1 GENE.GEMP01037758.1~~GEMP01037758.1.p1  ORF type:complete len:341 (+),score=72.68 GEMP01037758.1:165-1187(+)